MTRVQHVVVALSAVLLAACSSTGTGGTVDIGTPAAVADADARAARGLSRRSYAAAVPADAESDQGLLGVHRVAGKLLFEIPDSLFGRDMLLISRIAQTPMDMSPFLNAGSKVAEQVVHWEERPDRVLLRKVSYQRVASDTLPIYQSVRSNNFPPIVASFPIEAYGPDSRSVVLDVTELFETDVATISGLTRQQRQRWSVRSLDIDRSFIDYARSFPLNVDVGHTLTFEATEPPSNEGTGTISLQMHQSMVLLPSEPMRVRYADSRVGWFTIEQVNFGLDEQKAATQRIIRRWRLEPTDPEAYARGELVEPVKPIVYYLDPATPEQWRPYFRMGIEDWQAAFEAAGFKNAIVAKLPPSPEEDPGWSPEDVRYSTIRYVANMTRNATGPSVSDPRSGEIIESDVIWYHNHIRSYRNRLMVETGAANPAARSLMIDETLIGETMRQVIAHEVGHALGLPHNMIASSSFPVDSLRSPTFTSTYGVAPTIMDYARQNYIAQPGDGVERFVRKIGPYDHYAINWGYRVLADAAAPEDEKPVLDEWILERASDPMYRFGSADGVNPWAQTEDMGDDPVRASTYAIANLKRVLPELPAWTAADGEDYEDLEELYGELVNQWNRYVGHVVTLVGGVYETRKTSDQGGQVYEVVPREKQAEAVQFIIEEVFKTPTWLQSEKILRRIEAGGAVERIRRRQVARLEQLLDPERMQRLIEAGAVDGPGTYSLIELMNDIREGVWSELATGAFVDTNRRNLQRAHVERLAEVMEDQEEEEDAGPGGGGGGGPGGGGDRPPVDVSQSDIPALARAQLARIREDATTVVDRSTDLMTRYHLEDVIERIGGILAGGDGG